MSQPDFHQQSADVTPPGGATHRIVPPALPTLAKEPLSAGAIAAICFGSVFTLCTGIVVIAALLTHRTVAQVPPPPPRAEQGARPATPPPPLVAQATPVSTQIGRRVPIEPGVTYTNVRISSVPWSVHIVKVDRSHKDLGFYSAHARNKVLGVSVLSEQARTVPADVGRAIAAINGDFYLRDNPTYAGDPRGLQIINGELISAPDTACVWFDANGNPNVGEVKGDFAVKWPNGARTRFGLNQQRQSTTAVLYTPTYGPSTRVSGGRELVLEKEGDGPWLPLQAGETYRARVRDVLVEGNTPLQGNIMVLSLGASVDGVPAVKAGDVIELSTATTPELKGVKAAIAGGPAIIQNGKPFALFDPPPGLGRNYSEASKYQRHPRSAIGWSPTHVYFVTVDGRQPGLSVGMKLAELAEFMVKLGCTDAMNLDGGKSAQLWMSGAGILNSPAQGEDTVANSLILIRRNTGG